MSPHALSDSGASSIESSCPPDAQVPNEPLAICGMACRLPGDSSSPKALWELLSKGRSGQGPVPKNRFNVDAFYHPNGAERTGSVSTQGGYFLDEDCRQFDNSFFGINNLEATYMDPQQRKLLEVTFECLENAGVSMEQADGANTGVYVGNFTFDYLMMQSRDADYLTRFNSTGMGISILGNRISHVFNLKGPSVVMDTACSSSLYSLHIACTALQNHECDSAVVAGANLVQSIEQHIGTNKAGVLSATSECHTFDASADGYGRGEGVGALYVKRLSDALRDGDPIRSVVRASAINANGKTAGISLPSQDGQEAVIRKAMSKGGVHPDQVGYVECHGTGTKVGDAIEVEGLSRVFNRSADKPLYIGSVKSNLGHSEAASGIAGIIKSTLALEKRQIPPTHGLKQINPKLKPWETQFHIPAGTETTAWPKNTSSAINMVGINSFGYGGANAHVILEEAPSKSTWGRNAADRDAAVTQQSVLLPLSGSSDAALDARLDDFAHHDFSGVNLLDLAYTLGSHRSHLSRRAFLVAPRGQEDIASTFSMQPVVRGNSTHDGSAPLAFVFTGQGSQWPGMCRELFTSFPVFRHAIAEMDATLKAIPHGPTWSLHEAILDVDNKDLIHHPSRSQPCCTAIQVALLQLLASWDIVPDVTVGHSSGEIAAAFAAGHLTASESIVIAYYRGYCVSKSTQDGTMMAAGLSEVDANKAIDAEGLQGQVRVACINSPEGVTISGDSPAIDKLHEVLSSKNTFARKLKTGGQAYHSHHMLTFGDEYQSLLDTVLPTLGPATQLPQGPTVVSSVAVEPKSGGFNGAYWRANLESPVRFSQAVDYVHQKMGAEHTFIELGPHSSLELPVKQTLAKRGVASANVRYLAPVKRNTSALDTALTLAGNLWLHGYDVSWHKVNGLSAAESKSAISSASAFGVVTDLPRYRFTYDEKNLLWSEARSSVEYRLRKYPRHELLGSLIPGGNLNDLLFRNLLKLGDVDWLKDHKLEESAVFPGAGYLAAAMEAVMQAVEMPATTQPAFLFENVNILNPLVLSADPADKTEVFTSLNRSRITHAASSAIWWDFAISTVEDGASQTHAQGSISVTAATETLSARYAAPEGSLEPSHKRTWYNKLLKEGLNYGPHFQPITEFQTPRMKNLSYCSAQAPLTRVVGDPLAVYPIHPVLLDAMLQASIVASSNGRPSNLGAKVPTRFGSIALKAPSTNTTDACHINAVSRRYGFGSVETGSELLDPAGDVICQFNDVRLAPYNTGGDGGEEQRRHPMLRSLWKPDISGLGLMSVDSASAHLDAFVAEANSELEDKSVIKLGAMLDLAAHKNPSLKLLELGNPTHDITVAAMHLLASASDFRRVASYTTASFSDDGKLVGGPVDLKTGERAEKTSELSSGSKYNLILVPAAGDWLATNLEAVKGLLEDDVDDGALILSLCPGNDGVAALTKPESGLECLSIPITEGPSSVVVARKPRATPAEDVLRKEGKHSFVIVEPQSGSTELGSAVSQALAASGVVNTQRVGLSELSESLVEPGTTTVISLVESESPLLATISDADMAQVKIMTDRAKNLLWVTRGNILQGGNPDYAVVSGLSRALMLEQPSLKFYVYDMDNEKTEAAVTAQNMLRVLVQAAKRPDMEWVQAKGVPYVSRFTPDDGLNTAFRAKQGLELTKMAVQDAGNIRLDMAKVGQFDSIFYRQHEEAALAPDALRVKVASIGLNAKDYYLLAGKVDVVDATPQNELTGTVTAVGSQVEGFSVGDRVVSMAPRHIQTYQDLQPWTCVKLQADEDWDTVATLPVVYSTALYALNHRARLQTGETILIHSAAGGVGIAAIQLAHRIGAQVIATVSTEAKKEYLVKSFGVNPANIFSSRDTSFLEGVRKVTNGRGVDVALNSLTGDLLHATWKCMASCGRFVEIGKLDLTTAGRLQMDQFLRNTTFTAFDLSYLYHSKDERDHSLWHGLLAETMDLFRKGDIVGFDPKVFDLADATDAFRSFANRDRIGKLALNLARRADAVVPVQPCKFVTTFSPEKSYIMIGCLGGLGRTMARWMMQRGARRFVFLGRSGLDKPAARGLVTDLESSGAECTVVKGDVCSAADVEAAVAASAPHAIGGVVQAAMGLNEALFTAMPNQHWHTGIDPKVQGTWNLHRSLQNSNGRDSQLDFFLMTSSISGSVGTATEANYCAGNHFLDLFARYRRSLNLPAVAVGLGMISEVGYLHDNPEIEALLLRKGIQAIDQDELLQILDASLSSSSLSSSSADGMAGIHHPGDALAVSHVLTGLEPMGIRELRKQGFEATSPALEDDPRAALLRCALYEDGEEGGAASQNSNSNLPNEVDAALKAGESLEVAVLNHIRRRFGNLVLMKYDAVDTTKRMNEYGMDSMIAAEFRSWFYSSFKVDIPFLMLLSKTCTLETLRDLVVAGLLKEEDEQQQ